MAASDDDKEERPSPLFDSDRVVFSGRFRRSNNGAGSTGKDAETTASFPIKKIAFKNPAGGNGPGSDAMGAPAGGSKPLPRMNSFQLRALRQQQEEFEAMKREAKAAGMHACRMAHMGYVPGVIYNDGESTKITCLKGSFGVTIPEKKAKIKKKKLKKKHSSNSRETLDDAAKSKQQLSNSRSRSDRRHMDTYREEEKEEIKEEEEEEISVPHAFETRTATTSPTTHNNSPSSAHGSHASASQFSNSSKLSSFDPKRLFKTKQNKGRKHVANTPDERALEEAKKLLSSGAWMCGVCGTPFEDSESASRHEKRCLVEWLKHDKLVRQGWRDYQQTNNELHGVPDMFTECSRPLDYPQYLPPVTGGEIAISSYLVRKYLLMTDEALVNVARRQRHILHEVIDRDLCALSLKKQKAREEPSSTAADEYTDLDGRIHEDLFIWEREYDALRELKLASRDRHYYAALEQRAMERRYGRQPHLTHHDYYYHRLNRVRRTGSEAFSMATAPNDSESEEEKKKFFLKAKVWGRIKGRFDHAYKLAKEGPALHADGGGGKRQASSDRGDRSAKKERGELKHDKNTLYINVVVKNSIQVVNNELQRIARGWWQTEIQKGEGQTGKEEIKDFQFEWIRAHTQKRVIRLAGIALASDFTPRKVAVQLSQDLLRLMEPQLKNRGVSIHAVIEYREGQYFVLAVNILEIDWDLFMQWLAKNQSVQDNIPLRQSFKQISSDAGARGKSKKNTLRNKVKAFLAEMRQRFPSKNEVVAQLLFFMYRMHVSAFGFLAVPILQIWYIIFLKYPMDKFILNAVTDDIFRYVEKKGMEMQLGINRNNDQASFMMAALREIRHGGKKMNIEDGEEEDDDAKPIIGPLMGPAVKNDINEAKAPAGFSPPDVLEFIGLETDLPVGFLRLRWALLHTASSFMKEAFFADVMKYDKVEMGQWSSNENEIGLPISSDGVDEGSFIGSTLEYSYLMPKSAFVKANMCYATMEILQYDGYCLVIKEKTLTPEVPYGNSFISWTKYAIVNSGKNTCRMVCSVEAEFPNGQPMVARQIKSGLRSGAAEKFVLLGETICRYAEAFP